MKTNVDLWQYPAEFFLEWEGEICSENETQILYSVNCFLRKYVNNNNVEKKWFLPDRPQITIYCLAGKMNFAWLITKAKIQIYTHNVQNLSLRNWLISSALLKYFTGTLINTDKLSFDRYIITICLFKFYV